MIALTAALKAGKVTQDATFSGSLFQSLGRRWKKLLWQSVRRLKGMWSAREWFTSWIRTSVKNKDIGSKRETSKNFEDMNHSWAVTMSFEDGKGRAGKKIIMFQVPGLQYDPAGKPLDGLQTVKVLLRGCHVAQLYYRIGRTRVMYRVWRTCSGAKWKFLWNIEVKLKLNLGHTCNMVNLLCKQGQRSHTIIKGHSRSSSKIGWKCKIFVIWKKKTLKSSWNQTWVIHATW